MGLQPREPSRLASRPTRRSSTSDLETSPKHSVRRLNAPSKAEPDRLNYANLDRNVIRPKATMAASSPRRPARYSTGDVPVVLRGASGSSSPRRPNRHSFSMSGSMKIKEEGSDGEDEVDGAPVFDIRRLANSPKPPRKNASRPLRHSVCVPPNIDLLPQENSESQATSAADRKQKRVRFSVPDIRLTEEQLEELAATASAAAQDRENQLAAPCSDIFRKTMLDMHFLSLEQRRERGNEEGDPDCDTRSSSPPSNDS